MRSSKTQQESASMTSLRKSLLTKGMVPSYLGCQPATTAASNAGRGNVKSGTRPERLLEAALKHLGLRFKRQASNLPGNPDIALSAAKVAVFCDGDFWHGRNWNERRAKLARGTNASYWIAKIEHNRSRDRAITRKLRSLGWRVVRVWGSDAIRNPEGVARVVIRRARITGVYQHAAPRKRRMKRATPVASTDRA